jgi:cyclopropane fatty-acyl-phospholipid synthase-like methyltransferase
MSGHGGDRGGGKGHGRRHGHEHDHGHGGGEGRGAGHGHDHRRDAHGNPVDLDRYVARMLDEERAAWQRPDDVVAALGLRPGDTVGEIGAGPGYFTLRLARAVGPSGRVLAVDVAPELMAVLRQRLEAAGLGNVTPILAEPQDPHLPEAGCDLVLVVDSFHHFPDGTAYLRGLASRLKPGGRIVNLDFHKREMSVGPPVEHKISREEFLATAREAGLVVVEEKDFLPHQYFLVLRPG